MFYAKKILHDFWSILAVLPVMSATLTGISLYQSESTFPVTRIPTFYITLKARKTAELYVLKIVFPSWTPPPSSQNPQLKIKEVLHIHWKKPLTQHKFFQSIFHLYTQYTFSVPFLYYRHAVINYIVYISCQVVISYMFLHFLSRCI